MFILAAALGGLGLACMILRPTLLGILVGAQLLILGSTCALVLAGVTSPGGGPAPAHGHLFGLFVTLGGVAQLVTGFALAVRLFYLKKNARMEELRSLRH